METSKLIAKEASRIHSLFWDYDHFWTLNKKSFEQAKAMAITAAKLMKKEYRNAVNAGLRTQRYDVLLGLQKAIRELKYVKK